MTQATRTVDIPASAAAAPPATTASLSRTGSASAWAVFGAVWLLVAINAYARWMMSDTLFAPAPILPGDDIANWRLIGIRILEVLSTLAVIQLAWKSLIKPWIKERRFGLEAMLLLSGVIGFCADGFLNLHEHLFAFNAHSINMGVWTAFLPFHTNGPTVYAESLLWGFPMYVYFGLGAAYAGCALIAKLRQTFPGISNASAYFLTYLFFCVADFILENAIIRTTDAYMFVKTWGPLTVFEGSLYQFPLYESLFASIVSIGFTAIRQSALESADGLSFVERGAHRFHPRLQPLIRLLAVLGATGALFALGYHLPFNWLGTIGTSVIDLPSYMQPGMLTQ